MKRWMMRNCCCCLNKNHKGDLEFQRKEGNDVTAPGTVAVYDIVSAGSNGKIHIVGGGGGGIVNEAYDDVIIKQPTSTTTRKDEARWERQTSELSDASRDQHPGKSLSDLVFEELEKSQSLSAPRSFVSASDSSRLHPLPPDHEIALSDEQVKDLPDEEEDIFASLDRVSTDLPRDDLCSDEPDQVDPPPPPPEEDTDHIHHQLVSQETGEKCPKQLLLEMRSAQQQPEQDEETPQESQEEEQAPREIQEREKVSPESQDQKKSSEEKEIPSESQEENQSQEERKASPSPPEDPQEDPQEDTSAPMTSHTPVVDEGEGEVPPPLHEEDRVPTKEEDTGAKDDSA